MLRRRDQLTWALILLGIFVLLVPRIMRVLRGTWVSVETPPRYFARFEVDVNQADWPELTLLPGVGEVVARRIVEYRKQHGPFEKIEDLLKVPGIGPQTLSRIRPFVQITLPGEREAPENQDPSSP
jgi:competence ComEA-like helix-hairpin-helix protein